ncbi:Dihydroorotase [Roseimaritima multifibrata]|uniref:Dihydroorotase n=1 Tax=Roseimaritima multifibrata TaxID=1930274 RepID=A0A517MD28_9BACT|nr:dihydroorotase [Roseimaritima multifibrata]QDS92794.1 Dihydroorotase [Roseimaritima multifibrata]
MSSLFFKNAQVVFPDRVATTNVFVRDGVIVDVDAPESTSADVTVDAQGRYLMPGVIDDQVHFRDPGLTHKEDLATASRACAAGGVTTFLEMPNTRPPAITMDGIRLKENLAAEKSLVNYGFYIGATSENVSDLQQATNVPGIKIFIGSSTGNLLVDEQQALEQIFAQTTLPICAHCEDETMVRENTAKYEGVHDVAVHSKIRDVDAAVTATKRAIDLSLRHKHRFHVLHVSTAAELPLLANTQPYVTAEVCPHHLFFNVDDYERLGTLIQMNPSIKSAEDNRQLWEGLLQGAIQVIATDHAPHTWEEKQAEYPSSPSGLPAVENSLALMLNQVSQGKCTLTQVASWMCDAPARVWGIVGKGRIANGYDADLVLVDMEQRREIENARQHTKSRWSPWHGTTLTGWPVATWVNGQQVYGEHGFDESVRGAKPQFDHQRGGFWATPDGIGLR